MVVSPAATEEVIEQFIELLLDFSISQSPVEIGVATGLDGLRQSKIFENVKYIARIRVFRIFRPV